MVNSHTIVFKSYEKKYLTTGDVSSAQEVGSGAST